MDDPTTCPHDGLYWYAAPANEEGWKCIDCEWKPGEPPGFSPAHDRSHLTVKVECIVRDLHDHKIVYVSNGDCADGLISTVVAKCKRRKLYDSISIARLVLEIEGDDRHAKFWREIGEGVILGKDPRKRCHCGRLATIWQGGHNGGTHACCWEHLPSDPEVDNRETF